MSRLWAWLAYHRPRFLIDVPFVVARRSTLDARERNAFQLGRDYESSHPSERV